VILLLPSHKATIVNWLASYPSSEVTPIYKLHGFLYDEEAHSFGKSDFEIVIVSKDVISSETKSAESKVGNSSQDLYFTTIFGFPEIAVNLIKISASRGV